MKLFAQIVLVLFVYLFLIWHVTFDINVIPYKRPLVSTQHPTNWHNVTPSDGNIILDPWVENALGFIGREPDHALHAFPVTLTHNKGTET